MRRTQELKPVLNSQRQKPFHELAQQQKDAAADHEGWQVLEKPSYNQWTAQLNFQVAQPHRVCQSCQGFMIESVTLSHSLEEKLSLNAHQNSHKVARFFEDSRYRAGQYENGDEGWLITSITGCCSKLRWSWAGYFNPVTNPKARDRF